MVDKDLSTGLPAVTVSFAVPAASSLGWLAVADIGTGFRRAMTPACKFLCLARRGSAGMSGIMRASTQANN
jgi:hypothetical protein